MREYDSRVTPAPSGPVFVRGRTECRRQLSERQLVSDPALAGLAPDMSNNMLFMEGELHQRLRDLVMPHLTRPRVDALREHLDDLSRSLVAAALEKPDADLVADVAEPLVLAGILTAMQVRPAHWQELGDLSRKMLGFLEPDLPPAARRATTMAMLRAMMLFERDAAAGRAAGLHAELEAAAVRGLIPAKAARATPVVLLHGGYENPLNQLGCVLAAAVSDPAGFRRAASTAPATLFEEILRVYSPMRVLARWAASDSVDADADADTETDADRGPSYRRGDLVLVDLESANTNGCPFSTADLPPIDVSQKRSHLEFGYGRHACPGATLARMEGHALIRSLTELASDDELGRFAVEWHEGIVARGAARIARP